VEVKAKKSKWGEETQAYQNSANKIEGEGGL